MDFEFDAGYLVAQIAQQLADVGRDQADEDDKPDDVYKYKP